jgi:two-component system, chemotaxis family, chemotaxis protein CheY
MHHVRGRRIGRWQAVFLNVIRAPVFGLGPILGPSDVAGLYRAPLAIGRFDEGLMAISVLVVDDDIAALEAARRVLSTAGYAVAEALNGGEALERIMANPPDVLITDILMPEGDGIELITEIRRTHPALRVIAVTDRRLLGALDLLDLAKKLGADATLEKPLAPDGLLAAVAKLAGSQGAAGELH